VVAVEGAKVGIELRVGIDRLRDQHRCRMANVSSSAHEQLEGVVQQGRVRPVAFERVAAGAHPGDVSLDGVDLAVVAEQSKRLCPFPRRLGVRREALMEDPERHGEVGITEIRVEGRELVSGAERFVGHRAEREGRDVQPCRLVDPAPCTVGARLGLVE
jgi:hypothetical protein